MFSPQEYAFAAQVLGLPVPQTPAEKAAAAPLTARVLREYMYERPPMPGREEGMQTGATRSLNGYPDTREPMLRNAIGRRLQAGVETSEQDGTLEQYLMEFLQNPELVQAFFAYLEQMDQQGEEQVDMLSSQRPLHYDAPNLGSNYSVLNAPSSGPIPPSIEYQSVC